MNLLDADRVPYGAVYFRYTNPPSDDWERDYRVAAEDGMNAFRHWFMWAGIQRAPDRWDWSRYDRQLELAAKHGITTVVAEYIDVAPEWVFRQFAHARYEAHDGHRVPSSQHGSAAIGGRPGLCLSNDDYRNAAANFLRELAGRYKDHPAMGGYDVWNECNWHPSDPGGGKITESLYVPLPTSGSRYRRMYCYCAACKTRFRKWLRDKYGDIDTLAEVWRRYGISEWDDIEPPQGMYDMPECADWLHFRNDWAYEMMQWRIDTIREMDESNPIVAHGIAWTLSGWATTAADDWRAASKVDGYGYTWVPSRKGNEPWKQWHAVDLVRAASAGKPMWHAEAPAGPLWMQSEVQGRPREDGRIPDEQDFRLLNMVSFAGGARGMFTPRWRSLLHGPLFGAFGMYGMDGERTTVSDTASKINRWINDPANVDIVRAKPVQGDLALLVIGESQFFNVAQKGDANEYSESYRGAYQGFFENNLQPDFTKLDSIDDYEVIYLPYPVHLESKTVNKLVDWVKSGGVLISEGCPGYWGDSFSVHPRQPGPGLADLFGVTESYVEFVPDLLAMERQEFQFEDAVGGCMIYRQEYTPTTATPAGTYGSGGVAVAENRLGQGRTLLIGTFPGAAHLRNPSEEGRWFFGALADWAGIERKVSVSNDAVTARLQEGHGKRFLWITNPTRERQHANVKISDALPAFTGAEDRWATVPVQIEDDRRISLHVEPRDAAVIELR